MIINIEYKSLRSKVAAAETAVNAAVTRTLVKVGTASRAQWSRLIKDELNLPVATIKQAMSMRRNAKVLTITADSTRVARLNVTPRKRAINVIAFGARQNRLGVKVKIKNTPMLIRHAFIANIWGGQPRAYIRTTAKRFPVRGVYTTSIEDAAQDKLPIMEKFAVDKFNALFDQQLDYEMRSRGL